MLRSAPLGRHDQCVVLDDIQRLTLLGLAEDQLLFARVRRAVDDDAPEIARHRLRHDEDDAIRVTEVDVLFDGFIEDESVVPLGSAKAETALRITPAPEHLTERFAGRISYMHSGKPP